MADYKIDYFDVKQPAEKFYYAFDFTNAFRNLSISDTDTINTVEVTILDPNNVDVTADMVDDTKQIIDGCIVYIFIQGGTSGNTYKGTVKATATPSGQIAEMDFYLPVEEL